MKSKRSGQWRLMLALIASAILTALAWDVVRKKSSQKPGESGFLHRILARPLSKHGQAEFGPPISRGVDPPFSDSDARRQRPAPGFRDRPVKSVR